MANCRGAADPEHHKVLKYQIRDTLHLRRTGFREHTQTSVVWCYIYKSIFLPSSPAKTYHKKQDRSRLLRFQDNPSKQLDKNAPCSQQTPMFVTPPPTTYPPFASSSIVPSVYNANSPPGITLRNCPKNGGFRVTRVSKVGKNEKRKQQPHRMVAFWGGVQKKKEAKRKQK